MSLNHTLKNQAFRNRDYHIRCLEFGKFTYYIAQSFVIFVKYFEFLDRNKEYNGPQNLDTKMRQERYNFPKNNEIIINGELTNAEESKTIQF